MLLYAFKKIEVWKASADSRKQEKRRRANMEATEEYTSTQNL